MAIWERRQSSAAPKRPLNAHAKVNLPNRASLRPASIAAPLVRWPAIRQWLASIAKGRCVRGTGSDRAMEITISRWEASTSHRSRQRVGRQRHEEAVSILLELADRVVDHVIA